LAAHLRKEELDARTVAACVVTSAVTVFAVASATGLAGRVALTRSVHVGVGDSAHFAVNDLLCVNAPASGSPRFKTTGVACSSDAQPYRGLDFWFTRTRVVITASATTGGRVLYSLKR
jgi:hypothetical protein